MPRASEQEQASEHESPRTSAERNHSFRATVMWNLLARSNSKLRLLNAPTNCSCSANSSRLSSGARMRV